MLERTRLLSDLTSCAAVVVGPSHEQAAIRSRCSCGLSLDSPCSSWCSPNGAVESRSVELAETRAPELLAPPPAALAREVVAHLLSGRGRTSLRVGTSSSTGCSPPLVLP